MKREEAKRVIDKAYKVMSKIRKEYEKMSPSSEYHDALYYQRQGANEELGEMLYDFEQGNLVHLAGGLKVLEDTLKTCKLANKIEGMKSGLSFIYG